MQDLFASGHVADLIFLIALAEGILLAAYYRRHGRGIAPADFIPNLVAGGALVLALRSALVGAAWPWTAACLAVAGAAHLADMRRRWRG